MKETSRETVEKYEIKEREVGNIFAILEMNKEDQEERELGGQR